MPSNRRSERNLSHCACSGEGAKVPTPTPPGRAAEPPLHTTGVIFIGGDWDHLESTELGENLFKTFIKFVHPVCVEMR